MTTRLPPGPLLGNFARALLEAAASLPTKTAVIESESTSAYGEHAARSRAIADALSDYGVRPDDRVAIFLPRGADAAASFFGALATGAIAVTVNETLRPRQIEHILNHSGAKQRADFFTYRIVLDEEKNALLIRASGAQMEDARDVSPDFFPAYRKAS
jgi:acyl-CoA synthetase (AMP-forming)/AMP-acid ligase II